MNDRSKWDHWMTHNAICPYCGHEDQDSWEIDLGVGIEGDGEMDCQDCGETYRVSRSCDVTYTTKKKGAA
jgi:ribosomal protein L32